MGKLDEGINDAMSRGSSLGKDIFGESNENKNFRKPLSTHSTDKLHLYQDPTYLSFKLLFTGIGQTDSVAGSMNASGFLGAEKNSNSALYYLDSIGDTARYNMLLDFKSLLIKLNTEYPWYFQSIDGLDDAWKRDISKPLFNKEVTITCLESIDLRMTGLMDLYKKITVDFVNRRYILPDNLRKFDMTIKLYDFRDFGLKTTNLKRLGNLANEIDLPSTSENPLSKKAEINEQLLGVNSMTDRTQISFDLTHCEFQPDDSGEAFASISNSQPTQVAQKIKISYQNIEENNIYRILHSLSNQDNHYYVKDYLRKELLFINDDVLNSPKSPNFIKDSIVALATDVSANVSAKAGNLVKNKLTNLLLGNVYGFSPSSLANINASTIVDSAQNTVINMKSNNKSNNKSNLGNVYGKGSN